jgi:hypothetical protein
MDKSFLFFVLIGLGFLYFITSFVGDIQEEDDKYQNKAYEQEHKYDAYQGVDSVGRNVLNLLEVNPQTQVAAWNESKVKEEFVLLFPDFDEMKKFAQERINGEALQTKLLNKIKSVEDKFFSGAITAEQAKQVLGSLK